MSPKELDEVENSLKELLAKGFIQPSMSPWCSPIVFVRKKDGTLRMCIDYRNLNRVTKKAKYPIPRTDETLERIGGNRFFSTLDLKSGYHQIAMDPASIEKTAFGSRFGQFEYLVMPFGLCNAPATFMAEMNSLFKNDAHVVVYMDDILIMSKTKEDHLAHIRQVMFKLQEKGFKVNPKKCRFLQTSVEFLGHVVTADGISPTPSRVECIKNWPIPTNISELRAFLGLANYYRKFIAGFSSMAAKLWDLTSTNAEFVWTSAHTEEFQKLKEAFKQSLMLSYPDTEKPFIIETDASASGIGGVLLQVDNNGHERPVAFESHKLTDAQRKYSAYELELYGLLHNLKKFRCYVEGTNFTVRTDHKALISIFNERSGDLPAPLTRWLNEIALYQPFQIEFKAGRENIPADVLSRRGTTENVNAVDQLSLEEKEDIIRQIHSEIGHLGIQETTTQVSRRFEWRNTRALVEKTVRECPLCQMHQPRGAVGRVQLELLPVVNLFQRWGIDVMGPLTTSVGGKSYVILAIDHFSRWVVAKAVETPTAEETVRFVRENIIFNYGIPEELISDQGANFTSRLFQEFAARSGITLKRTSPYHPQTNGATERANQLFKQILGKLAQGHGIRFWDELVEKVVWTMRTRTHATTGYSPYELVFSKTPRVFNGDRDQILNTAHTRRIAIENWEAARNKMKERIPRSTDNASIRSGTRVLLRKQQRRALDPIWEGPFRVLEVRGKTVKLNLGPRNAWHSIENLKEYFGPEERVV